MLYWWVTTTLGSEDLKWRKAFEMKVENHTDLSKNGHVSPASMGCFPEPSTIWSLSWSELQTCRLGVFTSLPESAHQINLLSGLEGVRLEKTKATRWRVDGLLSLYDGWGTENSGRAWWGHDRRAPFLGLPREPQCLRFLASRGVGEVGRFDPRVGKLRCSAIKIKWINK